MKVFCFYLGFCLLFLFNTLQLKTVFCDDPSNSVPDTKELDPIMLAMMEFETLMLNQEYEKALAILDRAFDLEGIKPDDRCGWCGMKYGTLVYLNLMLGREETFLKEHDKISREIYGGCWSKTDMIKLDVNTALYSKLGLVDKILEECEDYIQADPNGLVTYRVYIKAADALLVKESFVQAKRYLASAQHILDVLHDDAKKLGKPSPPDDGSDIMIKLLQYYIQHLSKEYRSEYSKKKPEPPKLVFVRGEKILNFKAATVSRFVSRTTGEELDTSEIVKKIKEEKMKAERDVR